MKYLKQSELGYMNAMEIGEKGGKCPYCRKKPATDEWVSGAMNGPGFCIDSAAMCRACHEKRVAQAAIASATGAKP